eukprot:3941284-Rhodomonas_salina.7
MRVGVGNDNGGKRHRTKACGYVNAATGRYGGYFERSRAARQEVKTPALLLLIPRSRSHTLV